MPTGAPSTDSSTIQALQQIAETARAVARMAEGQIELERKQQAFSTRLDTAARVVKDLQVRVDVLEDLMTPAAWITEEQATTVSTTVKALAELLTQKDPARTITRVFLPSFTGALG